MTGSKAIAWQAPVLVSFSAGPNAALLTDPDTAIFIADTAYELLEVSEAHSTLGTNGSAVTLDVKKATGTTVPASGDSMLASTFNLKAAINTVVRKSLSNGGLTTTAANRQLARGDRLCLDFAGTLTALTGVCVTLWLRRMSRPEY